MQSMIKNFFSLMIETGLAQSSELQATQGSILPVNSSNV